MDLEFTATSLSFTVSPLSCGCPGVLVLGAFWLTRLGSFCACPSRSVSRSEDRSLLSLPASPSPLPLAVGTSRDLLGASCADKLLSGSVVFLSHTAQVSSVPHLLPQTVVRVCPFCAVWGPARVSPVAVPSSTLCRACRPWRLLCSKCQLLHLSPGLLRPLLTDLKESLVFWTAALCHCQELRASSLNHGLVSLNGQELFTSKRSAWSVFHYGADVLCL